MDKFHLSIFIVVGPTTSGKSDLAIKIAKKFNGEIISADSRQVYRGLDIGTGKVSKDERLAARGKGLDWKAIRYPSTLLRTGPLAAKRYYSGGIIHHLIDVASPKQQFTAAHFVKLGQKALRSIQKQGKPAVIVGGTGFYIDALLGRINLSPVKPNRKLRLKLSEQSAEQLFLQLSSLDPYRAKTIDRHNKVRLIRAIEIALTNGKSLPNLTAKRYPLAADCVWIGLNPSPEKLKRAITRRLKQRVNQGLVTEVQNLIKKGVSLKRLDELGLEYRYVSNHLKDERSAARGKGLDWKAIRYPSTLLRTGPIDAKRFLRSPFYDQLLREIIKYSKRQMTWFKRNKEIRWFKKSDQAYRYALLASKRVPT